MRKATTIFFVVLCLIVVCSFLPTLPAKAAAIIHVPNNFPTIQAAVNAASPGDTVIVRAGTYTENVKVNKDHLTIKSQRGPEKTIVQAANPSDHVFEVTADYVSISGFTVRGATEWPKAGIYIDNRDHCSISNSRVSGNHCGIWLESSSSNVVIKNTLSDNNIGIHLYSSSGNEIVDNNVSWNIRRGFVAVGISLSGWSNENTISRNVVTSNDDCGIVITQSNNNLVISNTLKSNGDFGIRLDYAHDTRMVDNNLQSNLRGIAIILSSNNTIDNNRVSNHSSIGIFIWLSNGNNIVSHNCMDSNGYGIYLEGSSNNHVYQNDFKSNGDNAHSQQSTNTWNSPEEITYTYNGSTFTNYFGNYWSDYTGSDSNGDGIGDTPYSIDSDKDNYPLMEPFKSYRIIPGSPTASLSVKAVENARNVIGAPYLWGAKGRHWDSVQGHSAGGARWATAQEIKQTGYRWKQDAPIEPGIDCSGLIMWAYDRAYNPTGKYFAPANPVLKEGAREQWRDTARMEQRFTFVGQNAVTQFLKQYKANAARFGLLLGDPIYFLDPRAGIAEGHVVMYVGNGHTIHASGYHGKVIYEGLETALVRYTSGGDWFCLVGLARARKHLLPIRQAD